MRVCQTRLVSDAQPSPTAGGSHVIKVTSSSRLMAIILLVFLAARATWHCFGPIGVVGDEAYYWEWSRRLDWGYFSKPPGIAWIHSLAGALSSQSALGMKLTATVLAVAAVWFLYQALNLIAGERVAFAGAMAALLAPGNLLLGSFLTTDSQLIFFWNLGFWMSCRIVFEKRVPAHVIWVLGLVIGTGSLFKQMMLVQIPLVWIGVFWQRRDLLGRWELIVATLGSLIFLLPTLLWNISNEWITVEHTAHHFESSAAGLMAALQRIGDLYGVLTVLLSPVLFFMVLAVAWNVTIRLKTQSLAIKWLWLWGVLPFLVMSLMTLRQTVNANWPAVFFGVLIALVALIFHQRSRVWRIALVTAAAFSLAIMVLPFFMESMYETGILKPQKRGWTGYDHLATVVDAHRTNEEIVITAGHRHTASQLAFHLKGQPNVWHWHTQRVIHSQYDLWPSPKLDKPCLLVVESEKKGEAQHIANRMAPHPVFIDALPLHAKRPKTIFHIFKAERLATWPVGPIAKELHP